MRVVGGTEKRFIKKKDSSFTFVEKVLENGLFSREGIDVQEQKYDSHYEGGGGGWKVAGGVGLQVVKCT